MSDPTPHTELAPIKVSLIADLVGLLNLNLAQVVKASAVGCPTCKGLGTVGDSEVGQDVTCPSCGGVGAIEAFVLDMDAIKTPEVGRHIEQWEYKQGQFVPKFRPKSAAFAQLTKILGFDKAVLEVAGAVAFADTLSEEQRAQMVEQLTDLAKRGML
ncbi:hypothetical protein [Xanthomonas phage NEB7]|nr:hypothetical protein [Xanthomonas phage NEB7]